jgi:hypothetical protein
MAANMDSVGTFQIAKEMAKVIFFKVKCKQNKFCQVVFIL